MVQTSSEPLQPAVLNFPRAATRSFESHKHLRISDSNKKQSRESRPPNCHSKLTVCLDFSFGGYCALVVSRRSVAVFDLIMAPAIGRVEFDKRVRQMADTGIPHNQASAALKEAKGDVERAFELIYDSETAITASSLPHSSKVTSTLSDDESDEDLEENEELAGSEFDDDDTNIDWQTAEDPQTAADKNPGGLDHDTFTAYTEDGNASSVSRDPRLLIMALLGNDELSDEERDVLIQKIYDQVQSNTTNETGRSGPHYLASDRIMSEDAASSGSDKSSPVPDTAEAVLAKYSPVAYSGKGNLCGMSAKALKAAIAECKKFIDDPATPANLVQQLHNIKHPLRVKLESSSVVGSDVSPAPTQAKAAQVPSVMPTVQDFSEALKQSRASRGCAESCSCNKCEKALRKQTRKLERKNNQLSQRAKAAAKKEKKLAQSSLQQRIPQKPSQQKQQNMGNPVDHDLDLAQAADVTYQGATQGIGPRASRKNWKAPENVRSVATQAEAIQMYAQNILGTSSLKDCSKSKKEAMMGRLSKLGVKQQDLVFSVFKTAYHAISEVVGNRFHKDLCIDPVQNKEAAMRSPFAWATSPFGKVPIGTPITDIDFVVDLAGGHLMKVRPVYLADFEATFAMAYDIFTFDGNGPCYQPADSAVFMVPLADHAKWRKKNPDAPLPMDVLLVSGREVPKNCYLKVIPRPIQWAEPMAPGEGYMLKHSDALLNQMTMVAQDNQRFAHLDQRDISMEMTKNVQTHIEAMRDRRMPKSAFW